MKTINYLAKYKKNNTSQDGEDGIIEEIFKRLGIIGGTIIDVGAHDGKHFSNTFSLLQRGFSVFAIEKHPPRIESLYQIKKEYPNIVPIHAQINMHKESPMHINNIICKNQIPRDVEMLSIDIDSIDYWVFKDIEIAPKLVVVEIEGKYYPLDSKIHNPKGNRETNPPKNQTGFYPMYEVAKNKGYHFIAHTSCNAFFLRNDLISKLNMPEVTEVHEFCNFDTKKLSREDVIKWEKYVV